MSCQKVPILTRLGSGLAMLIWIQTLAYLPQMAALIMASTFKSLPNFCPMYLRNSGW